MTGLVRDRNTPAEKLEIYQFPPAAGAVIYRGALVAIDAAGAAVPAGAATAVRVVGRAETGTADIPAAVATTVGQLPGGNITQGGGGAGLIRVRRGCAFAFDNSAPGADQLTAAMWGAPCYAVDDHTLAATSATNTRLQAGIFRGLTAGGLAWVDIH